MAPIFEVRRIVWKKNGYEWMDDSIDQETKHAIAYGKLLIKAIA